jgi:hypothetical protein
MRTVAFCVIASTCKINPGDRRSSLLELTPAGTTKVDEGRTVVEAELARRRASRIGV